MRIAAVQLCSTADIAANFKTTETLIRAAAADGARFIATPENTRLLANGAKNLFASIADEAGTPQIAQFSELAKSLGIYLLIGSMTIRLSDTKAANRSFLFGVDGKILARYDKINMFDAVLSKTESYRESAHYQPGSSPVMADIDPFRLGPFRIGMSICYDLRFPALYKHYAMSGANLISIPAAFTVPSGRAHWEILVRARAIETASFVIAPAQGGQHNEKRSTYGHSLIIGPWGDILASLGHDEPGFCAADIDIETIKRARQKIPAWGQNGGAYD